MCKSKWKVYQVEFWKMQRKTLWLRKRKVLGPNNLTLCALCFLPTICAFKSQLRVLCLCCGACSFKMEIKQNQLLVCFHRITFGVDKILQLYLLSLCWVSSQLSLRRWFNAIHRSMRFEQFHFRQFSDFSIHALVRRRTHTRVPVFVRIGWFIFDLTITIAVPNCIKICYRVRSQYMHACSHCWPHK